MVDPTAITLATDALSIDQREAARLTGLSAKTLGRLSDAGEPTGRIKLGRRVLYHVATLVGWLASHAAVRAAEPPTTHRN